MYKQIAQNKRRTIIIMVAFVVMIGLIAVAFAAYYQDPWVAVWTVVAAIIYAVVQYYISASVTTMMTGAEEITKKDNPRLYNIVENLSITTGLPMPKVYVIPDSAPNAFATGRDPKHAIVAATTGLMDIMDDKELTAVMAHEMSHVKNYDIRVSMIVFGLTCVVGFITDIAFRMMLYGNRRRNNEGSPMGYLLAIIALLLSPLLAALAQMAVSRQREYLADASAVNITRYPEGMIDALKKLQAHSQPMKSQNVGTPSMYINDPLRKGFFNNLFSTHPPIEKRIERLEHGKKLSKKNVKEQPLGVLLHIKLAFGFILKNYKLFLPIILLVAAIYGLMFGASKETMIVVSVILFLSVWLLTLFFARRMMAGEKVKFRDGLFNAMTPLFSALIVMIILMIQCAPIMILIIANTAAIETNLFSDMFYGSLFVLFAVLMVVLSSFLLSGSLMALIAVSAPGMYPIRALQLSYELMSGKRIGFLFRLLVMVVVLVLAWVVIVGLAALINLAFINWFNVDLILLVPIAVFIAIYFSIIYSAVYLYIYYRKLLSMNVLYEKVDDK